ncbi:28900_t:CDS:1 [Dentiscutata erythropus]|uniref:28900_t:CDS:1 n=1 Tax=Dentiscutata erythropus TaxID=1348616 RepID=A0A9N9DT23_9GLOM|nr:28900_t:CDS:1 [Dentiscutata erythropus]
MSNSQFILLTSSILDENTISLIKCNLGRYYIECNDRKSILRFLDVNDALKLGNGKRSPPKSFILFRKSFQSSITQMALKIERAQISKHATVLWAYIKNAQPHLYYYFKNVSEEATDRYNTSNLKILMYDPYRSTNSTNVKGISREEIACEDSEYLEYLEDDSSQYDSVLCAFDPSRLDSPDVKNVILDLYPEIS